MKYQNTVIIKNGKECLIRNACKEDADAVLKQYIQTHSETDFLAAYGDENFPTNRQEAMFLQDKEESEYNVELIAVVDSKIVGCAGNTMISSRVKMRHRAEFGVSVMKDYWILGLEKNC